MPRRPLRVLAVALLALAACAGGPRVKHVRPQLGALPPADRVPVPLVFRYDPAFSRAWHGLGGRTPVVLIGEDSVAMLDEVAPLVADRVAVPPGAGAPADAFVLEPSLEHFDFFGWDEKPGDVHAVVFRMSLFEPGGDLVSSWTVEGRVPFVEHPPVQTGYQPPGQPVVEPPRKDGLAHASENLSEAARRFVAGFRRDSRIDAFLARKAAGETLALGDLAIEAAFQDVAADLPGVAPTLHGGGVVPVTVRITNRGPAELRLSGVTARLVLADGRRLHATGPKMIARRAQVASATAAGRKAGFGMIGAIAAIAHHTQLRSRLPAFQEAIEARALRAGALAPGASVEGVFYFLPQEGGLPPGRHARLSIWLVDEELRSARAEVSLELPAPPAPPAPTSASAEPT